MRAPSGACNGGLSRLQHRFNVAIVARVEFRHYSFQVGSEPIPALHVHRRFRPVLANRFKFRGNFAQPSFARGDLGTREIELGTIRESRMGFLRIAGKPRRYWAYGNRERSDVGFGSWVKNLLIFREVHP